MFLSNTSSYYPFLTKDSSLTSFKTVSTTGYMSEVYGSVQSGSYPYSSSISVDYLYQIDTNVRNRYKLYALQNSLKNYVNYSPHFAYSSSYGSKAYQEMTLISIPSIFFGSSINPGSVELSYYYSGSLLATIKDIKKNGELIQTFGSSGSGSVAGVVMYHEGFIILTGSWSINDSIVDTYIYDPTIAASNPKWVYWGSGLNRAEILNPSSSYDLNFEGVNYIYNLTMLAHAEKGDLNHSNNPTYVTKQNSGSFFTYSSSSYIENTKLEIKDTTKYPYDYSSSQVEKQTFITKIGIYDQNKNLIAVAKTSKPIRKTDNRDFTFKLKLDI